MSEELNFNELLLCPYCGEFYSKLNKPLVMKCSHNICSECFNLNLNRITCLSCNLTYEGKENKKHPINFLLLEIIEKSGNNKTTINNNPISCTFKCTNCNIILPNKDYHISKYLDHVLETIKTTEVKSDDKKVKLVDKSEALMKEYKEFNDNLTKNNDSFIEKLFNIFHLSKNDVISKMKKNNSLDNLVVVGVLTQSDKDKICEFLEFYKNERVRNLIKTSSSFDDIIKQFPEDLKIEKFLSAYFNYKQIQTLKLNESNIKDKLSKMENYMKDKDTMSSLSSSFSHDIIVQFYDNTGLDKADENNILKCPYILINEKLIIFDVNSESIEEHNIKELIPDLKEKHIHVSALDEENNLFIFTIDKEIYLFNLRNKSVNKIDTTCTNFYTKDINIDNLSICASKFKLYVIYNNEKNSTFDEYNYTKSKWKGLHSCPLYLKNLPKLIRYDNQYLYIFDSLRNFAYYNTIDDEWSICKPVYKDSYNLDLKDFVAIAIPNAVIILGGIYLNNEIQANKDIFLMKDGEFVISTKGEFTQLDSDSKLSYGFYNNNHFLLECNKYVVKVHKTTNLKDYKWESFDL